MPRRSGNLHIGCLQDVTSVRGPAQCSASYRAAIRSFLV
jgi:hypothetical protein